MKWAILTVAGAIAAFAFSAGATRPAHKPGMNAARGIYSEEQAREGAEIYKAACAVCHGEALYGTWEIPPLKGLFMANWEGASVGALYDYIGRAMPQMAPGSLSPEDNARIVAFLLKENGIPVGKAPLPTNQAALDRIRIDQVRSH